MAKATTKKFSSLMNKSLLEQMKRQADRNGQSVRFVLESAVRHYLEVVVLSARGVHADATKHLRASMLRNDGLLKRLAKAE